MAKITLKTHDMECRSCERRIEDAVKELEGVILVKSEYSTESTMVEYDEGKTDESAIRKRIEMEGYRIGEPGAPLSARFGTFAVALGIFTIIITLYFIIRNTIDIDLGFSNISMETGFAALFIIGLLTGFHCIGMCGGFVLSYAGKLKKAGEVIPHLQYGSGKMISYTAIGAFFGLVGSFIAFTVELRASVAILAGLFLVVYGLNMLNIFPALRKLRFRMPSFMFRERKANGPFVTGLLNGLMIACGPLQAMYIFAAGTGSIIAGAQALFFFGLGTLAPLLAFGIASNFLSAAFSHRIVKFSGALMILLGLAMAHNGFSLLGMGLFLPSEDVSIANDTQINIILSEDNYQVIKMDVTSYGWEPNSFVLKKGVPVRWEIDAKEINGCNNEIIAREYGLDIKVKPGLQVVEFTPDKEGIIRWSCWMGMIPGQFIVTDDAEITEEGEIDQEDVYVPELPKGSTCDGSCGGSCTGGCGCGGRR